MCNFIKSTVDFSVPLTDSELNEFNSKFCERCSKKTSVGSRVKIILFGVILAVLSIWSVVANVSNPWYKAVMILIPAASIAAHILSLFEKSGAISSQIQGISSMAMFIVLENTLASVGLKGHKESLFIYLTFTAITALSIIAGMRMWGRFMLKSFKLKTENINRKDAAIPILLISVSVVSFVRIFKDQNDILFILLIIVVFIMSVLFGFIIGLGVGNIKYMRYLKI